LSAYHLEAAIIDCHCAIDRFESTDWTRISSLYESLIIINDTPVTRLNQAIARGFTAGPESALVDLANLGRDKKLAGYYLLPASQGEFSWQLGQSAAAVGYFETALRLCPSATERLFLTKKLALCRDRSV
jgi:predicted RNA polymerase sigma factor